MLRQIGIHFLDQLGVVRTVFVQPEHGGSAARFGARDGQFDPILDRRVLHLAGTPDIAFFDLMLVQRLAGRVDDPNGPVPRRFEGLVVRAVLFRRLRHQADVGHAAHGPRIEGPVLLTELNDLMIDRRIAGSRE